MMSSFGLTAQKYPLSIFLTSSNVPPMDIEFIPSTVPPTGLGEPATTVVGPAIGNAIFAAVGVRLRHLPMRPADVLAALNPTTTRSKA
jgi:isoquinoline 1-oxidoreductase subunit beta